MNLCEEEDRAANEIKEIYGKFCPPLRLHSWGGLIEPGTGIPSSFIDSRKPNSIELLQKNEPPDRGLFTTERNRSPAVPQ
jgi:hypothetical protein